jgi:nucleoside triphosphate pyrophosphatase
LKDAGIEFTVWPAEIDEAPRADENPKALAERLATEKARTIRASAAARGATGVPPVSEIRATGDARPSDSVILAADTVVVVDQEILGKPVDCEDAARMLRMLSNQKHLVITGVCLLGPGFEDVRSETTAVHFSPMSETEIRDYIASGEPMDKAGAYAIQGMASRWISRIEGDYYNAVGLPVDLVGRMLRERGAF